MNTVLEGQTNTAEKEAVEHNSLIKERYEQLLSTEEAQLNESLGSVFAPAQNTTVAPTYTPVEPITPVYTRTKISSSLFTTETLERQIAVEKEAEIARQKMQAAMPVQSVAVAQRVEEASYTFSNFAKACAAAFVAIVLVMLAVIAINSRIIERNNVKIRRLEDKREELQERSEEIAARMQEITSEEYVKSWAEANGFVFD